MYKRFSMLSYDLCLERSVTYHLGSRLGVPNCCVLSGEVPPEGLAHMVTPVDYAETSTSSPQLMRRHHKEVWQLP